LAKLVEAAHNLRVDARASKMNDIEKNATSLEMMIQSARQKLSRTFGEQFLSGNPIPQATVSETSLPLQ
jgi:hypothetical protein